VSWSSAVVGTAILALLDISTAPSQVSQQPR